MELAQKPTWRQRLVGWVARLLGVQIYAHPFAILIYDMGGDLADRYRAARAEDEAVH